MTQTDKQQVKASEYLSQGKEHQQQGNIDQSLESYQKAIDLQPENPQLYVEQSRLYFKQREIDKAMEKAQAALHLNPDFVPALNQLATIYEQQKQFDQALKYFQQVVQLQPNNLKTKVSLARVMINQAKFGMAFEQIDRVLTIKPNYSPAIKLTIRLAELKHPIAQKAKTQLLSLINNNSSLFIKEVSEYKSVNLELSFNRLKITPGKIIQILKDKTNKTETDIALLKLCRGIKCRKRGEFSQALKNFKESGLAKISDIIWCLEKLGKQKEIEEIINSCLSKSNDFALIKRDILTKLKIDYKDKILLFICPNNVGDVCANLSKIKSICEYYQATCFVFYQAGGAAETLAKMFLEPLVPSHVAGHFPIDSSTWEPLLKSQKKESESLSLRRIPIMKGIPRFLLFENPLEKIPFRSEPEISNDSKISAVTKFEKLGLNPQRTVLIAPQSQAHNKQTGANVVLSDFWLSLFEILHSEGLSIAINARNHQSLIGYSWLESSNTPLSFADLSLTEVIPFVNYGGYFIGVMSGLCELLCFTDRNVRRGCIRITNKTPGIIPLSRKPESHHSQFPVSDLYLHYGVNISQSSTFPIQEQVSNFVDLYFGK